MEFSIKLFPVVLILLLVGIEMGPVQEVMAEVCQARCKKCIGPCTFDEECSMSCMNEGFDTGECRGAHHRCICKKNC